MGGEWQVSGWGGKGVLGKLGPMAQISGARLSGAQTAGGGDTDY